jgi:hypothetical protein
LGPERRHRELWRVERPRPPPYPADYQLTR